MADAPPPPAEPPLGDAARLALETARIEANVRIRQLEERSRIWQVILGTTIVGIAAAAFPFMQKWAEVRSQEQIEQLKAAAQIEVLERENQLKGDLAQLQNDLDTLRQKDATEEARRSFLNSLASEARSEQIEKRIILAEFFSYLAEDGERQRWAEFRDFLYRQQVKFARDIELLAGKQAADEYRLGQIQRSVDPGATASVEPGCSVQLQGPPAAITLKDGFAEGLQSCSSTGALMEAPARLILLHSTGSPAGTDPGRTATLITKGRADLPGPLAHFVIFPDGTVVQTASLRTRANHAGASEFLGETNLNGSSIGIELEGDGTAPWPPAQLQAAQALARALMTELGIGPDRVLGHFEVAQPPGRKTDPFGLNMQDFRAALPPG